jgi:hypothetical protein
VRRTTWVVAGAAAALALAAGVVAATRSQESAPAASLAGGPITELGGGGATSPLQALNDVWGLSVRRSTCEMCHEIQQHKKVVTPGWLLIAFNNKGAVFNQFGVAYRDVVFNQVAPAYRGNIFGVPQRLKEVASRWPSLRTSDSDGDGYSNELELMFGSMPGRHDSQPARPAAQLARWRAIIVRELRGKQITQLERDPRIRRVGPDSDGDRVPDVLETFVGTDRNQRSSTPLVAARRLAVYRQLLLDAGTPVP